MEHITTIDIRLSSTTDSDELRNADQPGPFFQGVLMELIDPEYATYLHHLPFNPYSQFVIGDDSADMLRWRICALNSTAASQLLRALLGASSINLRARGLAFDVEKISTEQVPLKALTDMIHESSDFKVSIRFLTPTSFKSKGEYVIVPSPRLIFQNLLMRYEQVYSGSKEIDFETVEYLDSHTRISSYGLRSRYFSHIGRTGKKIPAFVGGITLSFSGPQTAIGLANMLLAFGSYSGVGVKTSMGMGAMEIVKKEQASTENIETVLHSARRR